MLPCQFGTDARAAASVSRRSRSAAREGVSGAAAAGSSLSQRRPISAMRSSAVSGSSVCDRLPHEVPQGETRWPRAWCARRPHGWSPSRYSLGHPARRRRILRLFAQPRSVASSLQPCLLEDAVERARGEIIARLPSNCHQSRLGRMLVLMMTPSCSHEVLAIVGQQAQRIANLHVGKFEPGASGWAS